MLHHRGDPHARGHAFTTTTWKHGETVREEGGEGKGKVGEIKGGKRKGESVDEMIYRDEPEVISSNTQEREPAFRNGACTR